MKIASNCLAVLKHCPFSGSLLSPTGRMLSNRKMNEPGFELLLDGPADRLSYA